MKKLIFTLLATILCLSVMYGCSAEVKENPASDFEYKKSEDGDSILITKYVGASENVVIPAEIDGLPVKTIYSVGENATEMVGAFQNSSIKSVVIPDSVTSIGSNAFMDCSSLTEVKVAKNLKSIGYHSFENCVSLKKIDLSETVLTHIGDFAFNGCTSLREVKLPYTLEYIYEKAFYGCTSLTEIRLTENIDTFGSSAFGNCTSLETVIVSKADRLNGFSEPIFSDVPSLKKIIFEEGNTEIDGYAFFATTSDIEVIIPASVKKIEPSVFFNYGSIKLIFKGDCPELTGGDLIGGGFHGDVTICYDPDTNGWDECTWKNDYKVKVIK